MTHRLDFLIRAAAAHQPPTERAEEYYFDAEAAKRVCLFFEKFFVHPNGQMKGQPFILADWQVTDILAPLFGWKSKATHLRRFRTLWAEIPRANGKTPLAAGMAAGLLMGDGAVAPQIYVIAGAKEQAKLPFQDVTDMISASPALAQITTPFAEALYCDRNQGRIQVLSKTPRHGHRPHGVLGDEVHLWEKRDQYEAMHTALGKMPQPLEILITTAGFDRSSLAWELHEEAEKIRMGIIDDPTILPVIYAAEPDDDWTDPAVWAKANPNLDISLPTAFLQRECERAMRSPALENTFRQLHLNQWTSQKSRWLSVREWDAGKDPIDQAPLRLRPCYLGVDLAEVHDMTALVLIFPPVDEVERLKVLAWFMCPEENIRERSTADRAPYEQWVKEGFLKPTPGARTDFRFVEDAIRRVCAYFNVRGIGFDKWRARQMMASLMDDGYPVVEVTQSCARLVAPSAELERLVIGHEIQHGGHPILRWNVDNATVTRDPSGNFKPNKSSDKARIDGLSALINALGVKMQGEGAQERPSIYTLRAERRREMQDAA